MDAIRTEELLAHRTFVRSLALALVRDETRADDLTQETWLRALRRPPRPGSLRAWLARVLRNLVADEARTGRHRAEREERVAVSIGRPGNVDAVARAEAAGRVLSEVLALAEPYRTAILLRFYEGLPPAEVARRTGAPVETVRTRIRRALERLRRRLDESHDGDRRAWAAPLLASTAGAFPKALLVVAAAAVLILAVSLGVGLSGSKPPPAPPGVPTAASAPEADAADAAADAPVEGTGGLTGRILRWRDRSAVSDVAVAVEGPVRREVRTDAAGRFLAGDLPAGDYRIRAASTLDVPGVAVAADAIADAGTLWLSEPLSLPVRVTDSRGAPVAGATVVASLRRGTAHPRRDSGWRESTAGPPTPAVATATAKADDAGRAILNGLAPGLYDLAARAPGFATTSRREVVVAPEATRETTLVLLPGRRLAGRVVDTTGAPVADARVIVAPSDDYDRAEEDARLHVGSTLTDADGRFAFDDRPSGRRLLWIEPPAGGRYSLAVSAAEEEVLVRVPVPGSDLHGRVTDPDGRPVAGAELALRLWTPALSPDTDSWTSQDFRARVATDANGDYRLAALPEPERGVLRIEAPGFASEMRSFGWGGPDTLPLVPGETRRLDVVLDRGAVAKLRFTDAEGRPLPGIDAQVREQPDDSYSIERRGRTDAAGEVRFGGLVPGRYTVAVRGTGVVQPGLPSYWAGAERPGMIPDRWSLVVPEAGAAVEATFALSVGATVEGTVRDAAGRPVTGARVTIEGAAEGRPAITAADGTFSVAAVPSTLRALATASAPGFATGRSEAFAVPEEGTVRGLRIVLAPAGSVVGVIRRSDGAALVSPVLRIGPDDGEIHDVVPVAADGTFRVDGLPAGEVVLDASDPGAAPVRLDVEVEADRETGPVEVVLPKDRGLRGIVVTESGEPVAGASILAEPDDWNFEDRRATTGPDGRFRIAGAPEGGWTVYASAPGRQRTEAEAETAEEVRLVLPPGFAIAGRVVNGSGTPLAGIPVRLWFGGGPSARTDREGRFAFRGLAPGEYTFYANPRDAGLLGVERKVAAGTEDLEIRLEAGRPIEGRVLDSDGRPVRAGVVYVHSSAGGGLPWAFHEPYYGLIGKDGTFRIRGLPAGRFQLEARARNKNAVLADVPAGATGVTFRLAYPGRELILRIVGPDGVGVAAVDGVRDTATGVRASTGTTEDGVRVWMRNLDEDSPLHLRVFPRGFAPVEVDVPAGVAVVDVVLPPGAEVAGVVRGPDGRPCGGGEVTVRRASAPSEEIGHDRTDGKGRFSIRGLPPGPYLLVAHASNLARTVLGPVSAGADDVTVRLGAGESFALRVADADGRPVRGARVEILRRGVAVAWGSTDRDGECERGFVERAPGMSIRATAGDRGVEAPLPPPGERAVLVLPR